MGITSSLQTGLSGLAGNQSKLDVIGNNIANVNTVGFKSSRMDFKTQFSQSFSFGSAPTANMGGTNPLQVGMGVVQGAVTRNFTQGGREATGVSSHMAIEGDGFFIVRDTTPVYTRDGSFKLNSLNELVNSSGFRVQGYGVDDNYNVVPGTLQNLTIPLGALTIADATENMELTGNLNGNGPLPTQVSSLTLQEPLYTSDGAGGVTATAPTGATLLTDLASSTGGLLFNAGDVLNFTAQVGGRLVDETLDIGTSTLADLMSFMNGTLGINTSAGANGNIATPPGITLGASTASAAAVTMNIAGNPGTANDITLDGTSLTLVNGTSNLQQFTWNKTATADGESVVTGSDVFDSLGSRVSTSVVVSLIDRNSSGTTWRFYATSPDGAGTGALTQAVAGTGTLTFDTNGRLTSTTNPTVTIDRTNTGAEPNLSFDLDFGVVSGVESDSSFLQVASIDGSDMGTLNSYSIDEGGIIEGTFSNGVSRTLGQVALATFRNNQGLVEKGNNTFVEGPNSGTAIISAPNQFTAGRIIAGALELANVDLSSEFVQLIGASMGFSASSRIITTSNQLLQELLAAAR